jgi:hypothetical protein
MDNVINFEEYKFKKNLDLLANTYLIKLSQQIPNFVHVKLRELIDQANKEAE